MKTLLIALVAAVTLLEGCRKPTRRPARAPDGGVYICGSFVGYQCPESLTCIEDGEQAADALGHCYEKQTQ